MRYSCKASWPDDDVNFAPRGVFPPVVRNALKRSATQVVLTLLGCLLVLMTMALVSPATLHAAPPSQAAANLASPPAGLFFQAGRAEEAFEAPLLKSEVEITVNGLVSRVKVRQHFLNPSAVWLEGLYVFPLPENAAVDRMTLVVGARRIQGQIMEKADAQKAYQDAAKAGKRASLLAAERPNVFTTSVANVGPGEVIIVEIEYQDAIAYDAGLFSLRFPMVVAPRYTPPGGALVAEAPSGISPVAQATAAIPLGEDLFGPVRHPLEGPANPLSLTLTLDAGLPLKSLESLYHDVAIESDAGGRHKVTLQSGAVPADRDFVLEWRASPSAVPEAAIFVEEVDGSSHLMVMLLPPSAEAAAPEVGQAPEGPQPRDMIFIIDSSGSMHGPSMEQAKGAVLAALDRLKPDDRFNVIHFSNNAYALFERAEPASDGNLMKAWYYVKALEADGGTNMRPALEMALDEPAEAGRLRQVVFVTDGAVSNEAALFTLINRRLGSSRLFTVGIGSAPNSYFMRKAAESGRGSFIYIGDSQEVGSRMSALFRKLENPALTGIEVAWQLPDGRLPEAYPQPLPDLYAGEPVVMTARLQGLALDELAGSLVITGESGGAAWERRLSLEGPEAGPGIAALWARAKLDQIEDGLHLGERPDMVRAKALEVALGHGLVSRYTSLVAIDDVIARPEGAGMESAEIARNLPAGWSYEHVFGEAAKHMRLKSLPAPLLKKAGGQAIGLPQGASPARFQLILGSAAVLVALLLVMLAGRFSRPRAA